MGNTDRTNVFYKAHVANHGWTDWSRNGEGAWRRNGTNTINGGAIEAIKVTLARRGIEEDYIEMKPYICSRHLGAGVRHYFVAIKVDDIRNLYQTGLAQRSYWTPEMPAEFREREGNDYPRLPFPNGNWSVQTLAANKEDFPPDYPFVTPPAPVTRPLMPLRNYVFDRLLLEDKSVSPRNWEGSIDRNYGAQQCIREITEHQRHMHDLEFARRLGGCFNNYKTNFVYGNYVPYWVGSTNCISFSMSLFIAALWHSQSYVDTHKHLKPIFDEIRPFGLSGLGENIMIYPEIFHSPKAELRPYARQYTTLG